MALGSALVFCNVMNKIYKRTDSDVAFTQEYSRVSYPIGNVSTLSKVQAHPRTHKLVRRKTEERTFYTQNLCLEEEITSPLYFELKVSTD